MSGTRARARRTRTAPAVSAKFPDCPEWLSPATWEAYQQHRREKGSPMGPTAAKQVLTDLEKAKGFGHDPAILIGEAIASNWVGCVFKDRHFQPAPAAPGGGRATGRAYGPASKRAALAEHNGGALSAWLGGVSPTAAIPALALETDHATH